MAHSRQRHDAARLLGRRVLLALMISVALAGTFGVWNTFRKERESAALMREAEAQATELVQREGQLKADIANLQTDRGKEEALRQGFALAGAGEGLIVIVDQPAQPTPTASTSAFVEWLHKTFPWW